MTRRRVGIVVLATTLLGLVGPASGASAAVASTEVASYTGTLQDGATWIADVPAGWRGTLVLYSHGFGSLSAADAPDPTTKQALLDHGYALLGSSYDPNGSLWATASAARDQFESLEAAQRVIGRARLTLALGTSMGGLISAQEAQNARHRIDGAVSTCGVVGGAVDLNNYQLDGEYALSQLLAADQKIQLVGYRSPDDGSAAATQLSNVATQARQTAQGRARVALGTALLNMPTWSNKQATPPAPHDAEGIAAAQYDWMVEALPFVMQGRYFIELAAGGNASWNVHVNYADLVARSPYRDVVRSLYRTAGLDLDADLATLTRNASVRADKAAVASLTATSTVTGHLQVPVLNVHTVYDQLVPVEHENRYAQQVRSAGDQSMLRQAYVGRRGHCAIAPSEMIAALQAVTHRVKTGQWGRVASTAELQSTAVALGLGDGPAFVDYRPGPLVSHRVFRPAQDATDAPSRSPATTSAS